MSDFDHGPLQTFEITWISGHVEQLVGHSVTWPGAADAMAAAFGGAKVEREQVIRIHGEFDGHWRLVLQARESDIRTIRNVTAGERIPGGGRS